MSGLSRALSLAALLSSLALLAAAILASAAARDTGSPRPRARGLALAAVVPLVFMVGREPAQPFIAFALVAALAGPQPLALALAAGAAVLAALAPTNGPGSLALVMGAAAAAVAARVLGHTATGRLVVAVPPLIAGRAAGDPAEEEQTATVLSRLVVVLALLATFAAGVEGWRRDGTYLSTLGERLLAAALVGFAASETPRARGAARALTLAALLVAVLGAWRR